MIPSVTGEMVQWPKTLEPLPALLSAPAPRTTPAIYEPAEPALTTDGAKALGIREVIGEFTTGGFEYASGVNIRLAASAINGAIVKPGETFSFDAQTGPRGSAQGYVDSGIINNGRPDKAVGGGISQLATTSTRHVLRGHGGCRAHRAQLLHLAVPGSPRGDGVRGRDRPEVP